MMKRGLREALAARAGVDPEALAELSGNAPDKRRRGPKEEPAAGEEPEDEAVQVRVTASLVGELRGAFEAGLAQACEKGGAMRGWMADGELVLDRVEQWGLDDENDLCCLGDHFGFTFHTHPVLIEKGRLSNNPMLPSNSDYTGVLECGALLHGWLEARAISWPESPRWKVRPVEVLENHRQFHADRADSDETDLPGTSTWFDLLCSPIGLIVYHGTRESICKYRAHMAQRGRVRNEYDRVINRQAPRVLTGFDREFGTLLHEEKCPEDKSTLTGRCNQAAAGLGYGCWDPATLPIDARTAEACAVAIERAAGKAAAKAVRSAIALKGPCYASLRAALVVKGAGAALERAFLERYDRLADDYDSGRTVRVSVELLVLGSLAGDDCREQLLFLVQNAPLEVHRAWFCSDECLEHDWASEPQVAGWQSMVQAFGLGARLFNWRDPAVCFELPCPAPLRPLLDWHASGDLFWNEVRLAPIVRRVGVAPLKKLAKGKQEVVTEGKRGSAVDLPDKHWGYTLKRALAERRAQAGGSWKAIEELETGYRHKYVER